MDPGRVFFFVAKMFGETLFMLPINWVHRKKKTVAKQTHCTVQSGSKWAPRIVMELFSDPINGRMAVLSTCFTGVKFNPTYPYLSRLPPLTCSLEDGLPGLGWWWFFESPFIEANLERGRTPELVKNGYKPRTSHGIPSSKQGINHLLQTSTLGIFFNASTVKKQTPRPRPELQLRWHPAWLHLLESKIESLIPNLRGHRAVEGKDFCAAEHRWSRNGAQVFGRFFSHWKKGCIWGQNQSQWTRGICGKSSEDLRPRQN